MRDLRQALVLTALCAAAACGGGGGSGSADGTDAPAPRSAALSRAADCDDLLGAIRADARAKIRVQADELRRGGWVYSGGGEPRPEGTPGVSATPVPGSNGPEATDTNTQVPGVDEADAVEIADGRLYLLRGTDLLVLNALPPEGTTLAGSVAIEGWPLGMFVADGRALVVSSVTDSGPLGGDPRCGTIGAPFPTWLAIEDPTLDALPPIQACGTYFTKLTLFDVGTTPPSVLRELYLEGRYVAARRHGARARIVVQRDWGVPAGVADPWSVLWSPTPPADAAELSARVDAWERSALAAIDASPLADWVPTIRERAAGGLVERPLTCSNAATPPTAEAPQGATLIVGMDLGSADAPLSDALVLGQASEIYANEDTLVLAQSEWQAEPLGDASTRTALHVFALASDGSDATYRGSGFVPGTVLSQFSLDVRSDVVRAATSFARSTDGLRVTRVTTARLRDGELRTLGATPDLAPGEQLQAARFLGDRAYLVTFVQIDPLFVVDLADPTEPRVLGEVELPGFSEYLHPLDDGHLLTLGRSSNGRGAALRLFDVTDASRPVLTAERNLPEDASTAAAGNHLAFTFDAARGLLALPVDRRTQGHVPTFPPPTRATLDLYAVDTTSLTLQGTVDHHTPDIVTCAPPYDWEGCPGYESMQRGVFIGDAVYSISSSKVQVHALDRPSDEPLASVVLP